MKLWHTFQNVIPYKVYLFYRPHFLELARPGPSFYVDPWITCRVTFALLLASHYGVLKFLRVSICTISNQLNVKPERISSFWCRKVETTGLKVFWYLTQITSLPAPSSLSPDGPLPACLALDLWKYLQNRRGSFRAYKSFSLLAAMTDVIFCSYL